MQIKQHPEKEEVRENWQGRTGSLQSIFIARQAGGIPSYLLLLWSELPLHPRPVFHTDQEQDPSILSAAAKELQIETVKTQRSCSFLLLNFALGETKCAHENPVSCYISVLGFVAFDGSGGKTLKLIYPQMGMSK